jgi:hypothetical protein
VALKWMLAAMQNSQAKLGDRLVLIALADNARDETGDCWPSIATLMHKTNMSERAVQYSLRRLQKMGEIAIEPQRSSYGTNLYRLMPVLLSGGADIAPGANLAGVQNTTETVQDFAPKPLVKPKTSSLNEKMIYTPDFQEFWNLTNRKGSKANAFEVWQGRKPTAGKVRMSDEDREAAKEAAPKWTAIYPHVTFEYHVENWLKQRIWESDLPRVHTNGRQPVDFAELGRQKMSGRHGPAGNVVDVEGRVR